MEPAIYICPKAGAPPQESLSSNYEGGFVDGARGFGIKDLTGLKPLLINLYLLGYSHGKKVASQLEDRPSFRRTEITTHSCPFYVELTEGGFQLTRRVGVSGEGE